MGWLVAVLGAFALGVLGGVVLECYLPWPKLAEASMPSNTGLRWLASLIAPFAVMILLYAAGTDTWLEEYFSVLWYPFLGVALVLAGMLIERPTSALNPGLMRARPFLTAGLALYDASGERIGRVGGVGEVYGLIKASRVAVNASLALYVRLVGEGRAVVEVYVGQGNLSLPLEASGKRVELGLPVAGRSIALLELEGADALTIGPSIIGFDVEELEAYTPLEDVLIAVNASLEPTWAKPIGSLTTLIEGSRATIPCLGV